MPALSVSFHEIKLHMACEFICSAAFIYCFEFIFLFPLGTIMHTLERRILFFTCHVDVSSTNSAQLEDNLSFVFVHT